MGGRKEFGWLQQHDLLLLLFVVTCVLSPYDRAWVKATTTSTEGSFVYKDPEQPIALRVKDLLSRMTLEEKIGQMTQIEREVSNSSVILRYHIGKVQSPPTPLTALNVFGFQKFRINNRPFGSWKIGEKIWFRSHQYSSLILITIPALLGQIMQEVYSVEEGVCLHQRQHLNCGTTWQMTSSEQLWTHA